MSAALVTAAANEAANALCAAMGLTFDEAKGEYYYDVENVKRWVLGDGGKSGNCEICDENEALGWIPDDDVFESVDGDVDEPPAHPNCTCTLEYKEKRVRIYV